MSTEGKPAPATRLLYVELPHQDPGHAQGLVGRMNLSLYDTRDAAANWQKCVADHLREIGFAQGKSNPCVFWHAQKQIQVLVHGDDYASSGGYDELMWLKAKLDKRFEMKTIVTGHSNKPDVVRESKILNRVVRATRDVWEY